MIARIIALYFGELVLPFNILNLEYKSKGITTLLWNLVLFGKDRATGMRAYATHTKVDADIDEVILHKLKGMQGVTQLCRSIRVNRE